jgi:hypothetical protein
MQAKIIDRFIEQVSQGTATESPFQLGISSEIVSTTPFSKDIAALAYADGRMFYHYELRGHLPVTEDMAPEVPVWTEEGTVPLWKDGHLVAPKYFSFFLESVFAPYNPSHRNKWPAHELLHTLTKFYWNPEMNRFSCYIGARLSELLPVVHWYGLDEIFRTRCNQHKGEILYEEYCTDCERSFVPFYKKSVTSLKKQKAQAKRWLTKAQEHFETEMTAIQKEMEVGYRVPVRRPKLDSSSDAVGYLKGHYNRLTSWSFGSWVQMFLKDGEDYFSSLQKHFEHQQKLWDCILEGRYLDDEFGFVADGNIDENIAFKRRQRRYLQDIGLRALTTLEFCGEDIEEGVWPHLSKMADYCNGTTDIEFAETEDLIAPEIRAMVDGLFAAFREHQDQLTEGFLKEFEALGHLWDDRERETSFIEQGIQSGILEAIDGNNEWQEKLTDFVKSDVFVEQKPLVERFSTWSKDNLSQELSSFIGMEHWLRREPHHDEEGDNFAVLPEENWGEGRLRFHKTFRRDTFDTKTICTFLGWDEEEFEGEELDLFAVWGTEGPQVFVVEEQLAKIFDAVLKEEHTLIQKEYAEEVAGLLQIGVLVWLPKAL